MGWSKEPIAFLTIGLGIWITGGLHIDGLMDTADGLAAGKEKCTKAMKDSRVGASGVQSLALILLIQIAALLKLNSLAPLAMPIAMFWGRCSTLWAIGKFPYLHKNRKTSFHLIHWKRWNEIKPSLLIIILLIAFSSLQLIPVSLITRIQLIIGILLGIFPALIVPNLLGRRLGGHSGDTYGATLVLVETFILLLLALSWP